MATADVPAGYSAASLPSNVASGTPAAPPPVPPNVPADPFLTNYLFLLKLSALRPNMLNPAKLLAILDIWGAAYREADLQATALALAGVGAQIYGDGVAVYGTGNEAFILRMAAAADAMPQAAAPDKVNLEIYGSGFSGLNAFLSSVGGSAYSNLDTCLSSLNKNAPFTALVSPNTAYLQWLCSSKRAQFMMQPGNVYAPRATLATVSVGAGAALTIQTATGIPAVNDPVNGLQGYTPAPGLTAQVTAPINGTLTVTLTASGQSAQGQAVSGRQWTAQLDNLAAGQSAVFAPQVAGDRIGSVTAAAGQGSAGGGAFTLQSVTDRPAP